MVAITKSLDFKSWDEVVVVSVNRLCCHFILLTINFNLSVLDDALGFLSCISNKVWNEVILEDGLVINFRTGITNHIAFIVLVLVLVEMVMEKFP